MMLLLYRYNIINKPFHLYTNCIALTDSPINLIVFLTCIYTQLTGHSVCVLCTVLRKSQCKLTPPLTWNSFKTGLHLSYRTEIVHYITKLIRLQEVHTNLIKHPVRSIVHHSWSCKQRSSPCVSLILLIMML